jgi:hypothetical protein
MANLPPFKLKSRKPLWNEEFLMQPFSKSDYWKAAWQDVDIFIYYTTRGLKILDYTRRVARNTSSIIENFPSSSCIRVTIS